MTGYLTLEEDLQRPLREKDISAETCSQPGKKRGRVFEAVDPLAKTGSSKEPGIFQDL